MFLLRHLWLQKQTAGTTQPHLCLGGYPTVVGRPGPRLWRAGSQPALFDGQLPVPTAVPPSRAATPPLPAGQRSRALRPRLTDATFPQPLSLSGQCLPFASLPPEVGRLSLSGYGSRSGVGGRTWEAERRRWRWAWPWRSWCRGRALRWA